MGHDMEKRGFADFKRLNPKLLSPESGSSIIKNQSEPDVLTIDGQSSKEAKSFANENLEKEAKIRAHYRKEQFRNNTSIAALIVFWLVVSSFVGMALIWVYHLVTPENWHFLSTLQNEKLQTILFSAIIIKIGQGYLDRNL